MKPVCPRLRLCILILLLPLAAACTTSPAPPTAGGEPEADITVTRTEDEDVSEGNVTITTVPREARLFIDGREAGYSPLSLDLDRGYHRLAAEKELYYRAYRWVDIRDTKTLTEIDIRLAAKNGTFDPTVIPSDSRLFLGGKPLTSLPAELPAGSYTVRVEHFGYRDLERTIHISPGQETAPRLELSPAPFTLRGLRAVPGVFSALDPGSLGEVGFRFTLSAPAEVAVEVFDPAGEPVYSHQYHAEDGPNQHIRWRPAPAAPSELPPGRYRVRVQARSMTGDTLRSSSAAFRLLSLPRGALGTSLPDGAPGALLSPSGLLPRSGQARLSLFSMAGSFSSSDKNGPEQFPQALTASWAVNDRNHLSASGGAVLQNGAAPLPFGAAAYSRSLGFSWLSPAAPSSPVSAAAVLRYAYRPDSPALPGLYDGLGAGAAVSLHTPAESPLLLSLTVAPEVLMTPLSGGLEGRAVLRGSLTLETPSWGLAFSAALRSTPFGTSFDLAQPTALSAELHGVIPGSPAALSLLLLGELRPAGLGLNLGIGVRYQWNTASGPSGTAPPKEASTPSSKERE